MGVDQLDAIHILWYYYEITVCPQEEEMYENKAHEINPDDYKFSGKISNLFSTLAGRQIKSSAFHVGTSIIGQQYYEQIVARERKDGNWDVIKRNTRQTFTSEGWYEAAPHLKKLHEGVSKATAQQEIRSFEDEHMRRLDENHVQESRNKKTLGLFR